MFNGNDYTSYTSIPFAENTLSSNLIQTMLMDKNDILWIGTYAGLDRYDIATGRFTNYSVGSDVVISILKDTSGRLWVGTLDGLGCMAPGSAVFTMYRKENPTRYIGDNTVRNLYEDSHGRIFASTYDGLYEYNPALDSFLPSSLLKPGNPASSGVVYGISEDGAGDFWVARWGVGLIRIRPGTRSYTVFPLPDNRIYCMNTTMDSDRVLAGTWGGGLNVLDKRTGAVTEYTQHSGSGHRLTNDLVYSLYTDRSGLLWVGTNGGGLNVYDPQRYWFSSLDASSDGQAGLPAGKINALMEDQSGNIWIAVINKGLTRYNPRTKEFTQYRSEPGKRGSLASDMVFCLLLDSSHKMYIGTDKGLSVYDALSDSFAPAAWFQSLGFNDSQQNISSLTEGPDGSLWVGTFVNGLVRYFPDTGRCVRYVHESSRPDSLSDNLIYCTGTDRAGNVWIGTNRGLNMFSYRTGRFTKYMYDKSDRTGISSNTVYTIYEQSNGTMWFGTRNGGLCSFNPSTGTFSNITSADGLPSDTIVGIAPSHGDLLWVATQNGLVQFDTAERKIFVYRTSDGLLSQQFSTAHATGRDGKRYFGTAIGLVYFEEVDVTGVSMPTPPVAFTSLMINNTQMPVPYADKSGYALKLRADQKNINIGYTALDFSPVARYSYSYRLDGFDTAWIDAGDRRYAMYTNLSPGTYRFRVMVERPDNREAGAETALTFRIDNPLYLRWYAVLVYLALISLLAYGAKKIRSGIVLEKKVGELETAAIHLQSANSHLEELSYRDALTGIPNRRYFEYVMTREWEAARFRGDYLSVLMLDIDFFKLYNDTFGHVAGDEALKSVARSIQSALFRVSDVVARYGGEEFVVVLPDTNGENALMVCNRIMQSLSTANIPFQTAIAERLSLSVGCYTDIPTAEMSFEKFILRADEALYRAKNEGRNRVSIYTAGNNGL